MGFLDMDVMKKTLRLVCVAAAAMVAASCATPKKVLYLQDMEQNSQIEIENKYEAVITPNDELRIIISCHEEELSRPFNLGYGSGGGSNMMSMGSGQYLGYLVDTNGNIELPILGTIHAAGKTRLQLQDEIRGMLVDGKYIEEPFVMVRFFNYKIFFLGPDGGKAVTIPEERCTFLEALALAGDLSNYTRRDKIAVLREEEGKMTMRYLDPRSAKVFNDPYYMLQQNDMIITESVKGQYFKDELGWWMSWVSMIASLTSTVTMFVVLGSK